MTTVATRVGGGVWRHRLLRWHRDRGGQTFTVREMSAHFDVAIDAAQSVVNNMKRRGELCCVNRARPMRYVVVLRGS